MKTNSMTLDPQTKALLLRRLEEAERIIHHCRQLLTGEEQPGNNPVSPSTEANGEERVVHGIFDGEHMNGEDGQLYPVPANYASKSKLVEGDGLKLSIQPDGAFVYKQVGPIDRRREKGEFIVNDQGQYVVRTDEKDYRVLLASVTFYNIDPGDTVTVLLPEKGEPSWGAVDNVIKQGDSGTDTVENDE